MTQNASIIIINAHHHCRQEDWCYILTVAVISYVFYGNFHLSAMVLSVYIDKKKSIAGIPYMHRYNSTTHSNLVQWEIASQ